MAQARQTPEYRGTRPDTTCHVQTRTVNLLLIPCSLSALTPYDMPALAVPGMLGADLVDYSFDYRSDGVRRLGLDNGG